ncbi:hypothetical protein HFP51_05610 [Parasphingopyxis sp. CP4]|uniref:hypothetical protein n=1 Tax=Parasphingopyxis sp. CP4 TaxID=2724527 RepID=UPI0015A07558|nr:hypothetical protein [Parasphingopyxis sp. CP4]QLC21699.1 hypothetical protein HFP51_05610 [Parasphingopyxis sp. CP4]
MVPSKGHFPRAAGLFGRIVRIPNRKGETAHGAADVPSAESYRKMLLKNAVNFTVGRRTRRDTEA